MSDDNAAGGRPVAATADRSGSRRSVLLPTLVTLGVLLLLLAVFTGVWTDRLWFRSVDFWSVFIKVLVTRTVLFVVGAVLLGGAGALNIYLAHRYRPMVRAAARAGDSLERYRSAVEPVKTRTVIAVGLLLGVVAGSVAAGQWESYLLWRNGTEWGATDTYFTSVDLGFFVFDYPWLRFVTSFGFAVLAVSVIVAAVTHYLYGAIDLQARRDRLTGAAQTHLSILIGLFVLLKAWAYWLDRYSFAIGDSGIFTGIQYTDANARIPAKEILIAIALICAILLFVNAWRRSWLLPGIGLGLLVLSSVLLSGIWPAIMQSFQVQPSEADREAPFIARNIESTRNAYDVADVTETEYDAPTAVSGDDLGTESEALPNTRLLDPTLVAPAFEQLQQVRGYYSVPPSLDVDRYPLGGSDYPQDVVVAAREINLDGLDALQRNWTNDHTVYTHGYGMIAAYGDRRSAGGQPEWAERSIPPEGELTRSTPDGYENRIYFGENSPDYSIVGNAGGTDVEVDFPTSEASASDSTLTTYEGEGGVPIDGIVNQTLYALKFGEPNIVLSSRVNEASRVLYDRDPRDRVKKVAPWLTVDGNAYPAVVDGRILWVVDAYTTSNTYPNAERLSLEESTSDTLTAQGGTAALPSDQVTYLRNSVKATVDAYTGAVTLYEWDTEDPILQTWMAAFPDTVEQRDDVPEPLLDHLRYPEDLFKVQRDIIDQYHVTDPAAFYAGEDRWEIPEDPSATASGTRQPPYYLSVQMPGQSEPAFSLTSVYTPNERENLSAFVAVDSVASGDSYGEMTILEPTTDRIDGPAQIANEFQNDTDLARQLRAFRENEEFSVLYGNLLTVPAGGGLLYVQPIYTQRQNVEGVYPLLQYVVASFGSEVGVGRDLAEALEDVLDESITQQPDADPPTEPPGEDPPEEPPAEPPGEELPGGDAERALELLQRADALYARAEAALQAQDLGEYQRLNQQATDLTTRAAALLEGSLAGPPPSGGGDGERPDEPGPPAQGDGAQSTTFSPSP